MIKGLRTVIYPSRDLAAAKAWYSQVLGSEPTFDQPFYVGFSVAGFELGLVPDAEPGAPGSEAYWGVDDVDAELARLLALGGKPDYAVTAVGEGIRYASVLDPSGNRFCIIENPGFDPARVG